MRASTMTFLKALFVLFALAFAVPSQAQLAVPAKQNHIAAELVAAGPVVPGQPLESGMDALHHPDILDSDSSGEGCSPEG